ncbi:MAG: MFS transporter [Cytophagales bacterium]|nr:MAG: MFS transporter [Cytophagales bacterium]
MTLTTIGRFRWRICALIFCANAINYIDRQVLGLLAPDLEKQFGWSEVEYGYIVTAFQAAFAVGYVSFGWFIDRYGTKIGYAVSIIIWSLAAIGHGWARTVFGFGLARAVLGLGESGSTPAAIKAFAEYFPKRERALATGIFNGGSSLGAVLAPLLVPLLSVQFGWTYAFFITGALGFLWLVFWWGLYEVPERQARLSTAELAYIQSDQDEATQQPPLRWASLLRYRATWTFVLVKFMTDPIFWFYLYWLPKFFNKQYGLNITTSIGPLVTIYAMVALGGITGGWISSRLLQRGWSVNRSRKAVLLGSALCIVPIVGAAFTNNLWLTVGLIGLAAAAHQSWSAVLFTTVTDQFPKRAVSSVIGLGGMAGAVGGMLVATATGYLLELTGSYLPIFGVAASAYLVALGLYQLAVPTIRPVSLS